MNRHYLNHLYDQLEAAEMMYERLMEQGEYENAEEVVKIINELQKEIAWEEKNREN